MEPYPQGRMNKSRSNAPAMSIYFMASDQPGLEQLSCMWCKRTIADAKGYIDKVITTPMPVTDFDIAINIRCKLCSQNYRLLMNAK